MQSLPSLNTSSLLRLFAPCLVLRGVTKAWSPGCVCGYLCPPSQLPLWGSAQAQSPPSPEFPFPTSKTSPGEGGPSDLLSGGFWKVEDAQLTWNLSMMDEGPWMSLSSASHVAESADGPVPGQGTGFTNS